MSAMRTTVAADKAGRRLTGMLTTRPYAESRDRGWPGWLRNCYGAPAISGIGQLDTPVGI